MDIDIKLEFHEIGNMLEERGLDDGGQVQMYVDSEVIRLCAPYVPFRTGTLMKSTQESILGSGIVVYNTPYAVHQYFHPRKPGSASGPLRGPYWAERMFADHGRDIVQGAAEIAGGASE